MKVVDIIKSRTKAAQKNIFVIIFKIYMVLLFIIKLRFPKGKNIHHIIDIIETPAQLILIASVANKSKIVEYLHIKMGSFLNR